MLKPMEISENAMLFKDITQWIRNKTFLLLFFGLLFGSGIISFLMVSVSGDSPQIGIAAFSIFTILLFLYTMTIAGMGFNLTSKEFTNKTFELYELAGMSLERMILGKFLSLVVQFLFGYFCIVPFLFFSYLLGGLDFASIFGASFLMILFSVPLYLSVLLISLSSKTVKIGTVGRIFVILVLLYMGIGLLGFFLTPHSPLRGITDFIKALVTFDLKAFKLFVVFFLFYIQICFLLFYICCQFISSVNDSRELQIKLILFTLFVSWLFVFLVLYPKHLVISGGYMFNVLYIPLYLMMLIIAGIFYYHHFNPPIIVQNRHKEARGFLRKIYYIFLPGATGTHRQIFYLFIISLLSIFILSVFTKTKEQLPLMNAGSLCLQVPYFIVIPGGLLLCLRALQKKTRGLKALVIVWWVLSGVLILIVFGMMESLGYLRRTPLSNLFEFISLILSPLSTIFIGLNNKSPFHEVAFLIRSGLGIIGLVLMIWIQRRRRKLNENNQVLPV